MATSRSGPGDVNVNFGLRERGPLGEQFRLGLRDGRLRRFQRGVGVPDRKVLHDICSALVDGAADVVLRILDQVAKQGFDMVHVARDVLASLRNVIVAKVSGEQGRELLDLADEEVADVMALAKRAEVDNLLRLFNGFSKSFDDIAKSGQARAALEMTLVRLARRPALLPLDELLSRLGDLERRLGGGPPLGPRGGGGGGPRSSASSPSSPVSTVPKTTPRAHGSLALARQPEPTSDTQIKVEEITPEPPRVAASPWRAILDLVRASSPPIAVVLEHAVPIEVTRSRIALGYASDDLLGSRATEDDALQALARAAQAHFGVAVPVQIDAKHRGGKTGSVHAIDTAEKRAELAKARASVESHPLVRDIVRLFDAELRDIKLPEES